MLVLQKFLPGLVQFHGYLTQDTGHFSDFVLAQRVQGNGSAGAQGQGGIEDEAQPVAHVTAEQGRKDDKAEEGKAQG